MFKRFSTIILTLALLISLTPGVRAAEPLASGTAGDDITWVLDGNYTLTLTGSGEMYDYSYAKSPWYPHRAGIQRIEVGEGITYLGKDAFSACSKVTEAALPDTLTRIGANVFYQCKALEEITIPHGVTELGNNAFSSCTMLSRADLPDSLRTIGIGAFYKCSALTSAAVPEGVVSLGRDVFAECTALQTVSLPATLTQIGQRAFELCRSLTAITVAPGSSSFSHDSQGALYDRNKTTLLVVPGGFRGTFVIPDSVTTVGDLAAEYCSGMTGLQIPDSVTSIGRYAFSNCSLADVTIPESITVIPEGCFYYNEELASISIPETVTEIHGSALGYCEALTEIALPEGLQVLGNAAFWGCWQLESIVIPEGITELDHAIFYNCTKLETVKLPSKLRSIDYWCFQNCSSLTDLVLPDTLETIGANAFEGTHSLKSIVFPATLRELSAYSFRNSGLTEMTFLGDAPTFNLGMGLEEYAFGGVTAIAYYPMYNPTWTEEVRQSYSGDLTWVAVDLHTHNWQEATCTEPKKCTGCGVTLGEALGHDWLGLSCTRCDAVRENPFGDLNPEGYYFDPVLWALENGVTVGISDTEFGTHEDCIRAQVVTFLWRAAGKPEPSRTTHPFTDVPKGSYYEKPVLWALENGITVGISDTKFGTHEACSRAQVVTFLHRAAGEPAASGTIPFTDVPAKSYYAQPVLWAVKNGITVGISDTEFGTHDTCSRAQVVTFLYRAFA